MEKEYVFGIKVSEIEAIELKNGIASKLTEAGLSLPSENIWKYKGTPSGAFGFDTGWLEFSSVNWGEIFKLIEGLLAFATGIKNFLIKKSVTSLKIKSKDGDTVEINKEMTVDEIIQILKAL